MHNIVRTAVCAAAFFAAPSVSAAIVTHTSAFIGSPTYFNGFERIGDDFVSNTTYSEGGVTVAYIGPLNNSEIYAGFDVEGDHSWFPNGGGHGYTRISRTDGGGFRAIQLAVASGWNAGPSALGYQILNHGLVLQSGKLGSVPFFAFDGSGGFATLGFSGETFDELRIIVGPPPGFDYFEGMSDGGIYDSIALAGVPEPATWAVMILGFFTSGALLRRRQSALQR